MLLARRIELGGTTSVGWSPVPSDRLSYVMAVHWVITIAALAIQYLGIPLATPSVSIISCAAILLLGLPHGTFDIALIRQSQGARNLIAIILLYLGCAAAMYTIWQLAPAFALVMFFGLSIRHFSEDWADRLPPFLAHSTAIALLMAPAILHTETLRSLFELLVGHPHAAFIANVAILVSPLSVVGAIVGIVSLWIDGHRALSVTTALALAGMIFLPPLVGFALFFCLMHSPRQFAAGLHSLRLEGIRQWSLVVGPFTLAGIGIAAIIYGQLAVGPVSSSMIVSAFVTLSVLTLPHMVMPSLTEVITQHMKG